MKKTSYIPILLAAVISCSREETSVLVPEPIEAHRETTITTLLDSPVAVDGSLYVLFDEALTDSLERGLADAASLGMAAMQRVFPDAGRFEARTREMGMHRWYDVTLPGGTTLRQACTVLKARPNVLNVRPKLKMRKLMNTPNDTYFSLQWHYSQVNAPQTWKDYTVGSSDVIVAVVDEGVDAGHSDLSGVVLSDDSFNFVTLRKTINITRKDSGHGTHVAGTIAAINNNRTGCAGMAGGDAAAGISGARIISCQVFDGDNTATDANFAAAIKWGADHGAVISNNSWGNHCYDDHDNPMPEVARELFELYEHPNEGVYADPIKAAIDYFVKYAGYDENGVQVGPMAGGLVIFAAGNDGDVPSLATLGSPGNYAPVIAVGATNIKNARAYYSDYGDFVDICAPGGDGLGYVYSTLPKVVVASGYGGMPGTSMACPHVSGAAALLVSYFGGPGFTAAQCRDYLFGGTAAIETDQHIGPLLDIYGSMEYGVEMGGSSNVTIPAVTTSYTGSWTLKSVEKLSVSYDVRGFRAKVETAGGSDAATWSTANGSYILSIDARKAGAGTYTASISATNKAGTTTVRIPYTILPNNSPSVASPVDNILLEEKGSARIEMSTVFSDADIESGDELTYEVSSGSDNVYASVSSGVLTVKAYGRTGFATVTLTATDILGARATNTFQVTILPSSRGVLGYPVPMTDVLNVIIASSAGTMADIAIYGATGGTVYRETLRMDAFTPHAIDVRSLAPGRYTLVATYDGKKYSQSLTKH